MPRSTVFYPFTEPRPMPVDVLYIEVVEQLLAGGIRVEMGDASPRTKAAGGISLARTPAAFRWRSA